MAQKTLKANAGIGKTKRHDIKFVKTVMCHERCFFFSRLWVHINKRQEPRMLIIDHPFDWHTFDLFVGIFQPPGRLLDWAIDDVCEFVRLCHFFKVHENFLRQCLGISVPQEYLSLFSTNNTCDILFCLKSCGYPRAAKRIVSIADQSNESYDAFHLSDLLAAQTLNKF